MRIVCININAIGRTSNIFCASNFNSFLTRRHLPEWWLRACVPLICDSRSVLALLAVQPRGGQFGDKPIPAAGGGVEQAAAQVRPKKGIFYRQILLSTSCAVWPLMNAAERQNFGA